MDVGVTHRLPGSVAVIDANVKPAYGSVFRDHLGSEFIQ